MLKKLKIKFISAVVIIISVLIIIILLSINLIMINDMEKRVVKSMKDIAIKDGIKPPSFNLEPFKEQDKYLALNFIIKLDRDDNIIEIIYPKSVDISDYDIEKILNNILENNEIIDFNEQYYKNNNLAYFLMNKPYGKIIVFEDITNFNQTKQNLIYISILVYIVSFVVVFIIAYFLTEWIIKPVKENFELQKQFIANASHELKTPIAIISTNLSILEDENEDINREFWIEGIKDEIFKMNKLINELLVLSKSEKLNEVKEKTEFNLSDIITSIIFQYEAICFEKNRILKYNIKEDIFINTNKEDVITIIRIFLDNAIKYSNKDDIVEITLNEYRNKIQLIIFNTGIGIENKYIDKIFERFFRIDLSRNKEIEGYGLGLAIAKNIIENNKWSVSVESEYTKWVKFKVNF